MFKNMIELKYEIAGDDNRVLCYMKDDQLDELNSKLPSDVINAISSVGVSLRCSDVWYSKAHQLTAHDKEDIIFRKFYDIFHKNWRWEYGVPYFKFTGELRQFDSHIVNRDIFIFMLFDTHDVTEQIVTWRNCMSLVSRIIFIADLRMSNVSHFNVLTTDHRVAFSYLDELKVKSRRSNNFERYNLDKILHDWESDKELCAELTEKARDTITAFIYAKQLDLYVPGFLFFTSINYKRYVKAHKILTTKYQPKFIMTLPFTCRNRQYTVAFPFCGKL